MSEDGALEGDDGNASGGVEVYRSEVLEATLNPDWAPLDNAAMLRALDERLRVPSRGGEENAWGAAGEETRRPFRPTEPSEVDPTSVRLTLRIHAVDTRLRGGGRAEGRRGRTDDAEDDPFRAHVSETLIQTPLAIDRLVLVPVRDGSSSGGGGSSKGAGPRVPPNTPLVRVAQGVAGALGTASNPPGGRKTATTTDGDWYVPAACAWEGLVAAAEAAEVRERDRAAEDFAAAAEVTRGGVASSSSSSSSSVGGFKGVSCAAAREAAMRLVAARGALAAVRARRAELRARLSARVDGGRLRRPSDDVETTDDIDEDDRRPFSSCVFASERGAAALVRATRSLAAARRRARQLAREAREAAEKCALASTASAAREAALGASAAALAGARDRLESADVLLGGAWGRGRLHHQQRLLVARRWQLVSDLSRIFPITRVVQKQPPSPPPPPPTTTQQQTQQRPTEREDPNDAAHVWAIAGVPLDLAPRAGGASGDRSGTLQGGGGINGAMRIATTASGPSSAVLRSLNDPESVAAGLGYVTQAVLQLASILDVPLRYPVAPGASRSYICDVQQVLSAGGSSGSGEPGSSPLYQVGAGAASNRGGLGTASAGGTGGGSVGGGPTMMWRRVEFPLFTDHVEATRFTHAVFLLNKDLEQLLNAHGLRAAGPRHTLPNLRRIFAAQRHRCDPAVGVAGKAAVEVVEGKEVKNAGAREVKNGAGEGQGQATARGDGDGVTTEELTNVVT